MLDKFLKEVVAIVVGKYAEDIAELIHSKKHVNEFLIAKKLDTTINQTRNILYKLSDKGLVSSIRKKDKKKGWYTYFWKMEVIKALEYLKAVKINRINKINQQIENRENKEFYVCERCNIELTEEEALLQDFICKECGDVFARKDNTKILKELRKISDKLKKEVEEIDIEIEKEKKKQEKKKQKELEKEKKLKKTSKKKSTKKSVRKKTVKKKAKKTVRKVKKSVKKKVVKRKAVKKATKKAKKIAKKTKKKK